MVTTHNLGFPLVPHHIGTDNISNPNLQDFWRQRLAQKKKVESVASLRLQHWLQQTSLDLVPVGDYSFCDPVLNMSYVVGNVTESAKTAQWFDTESHYTVPEFNNSTSFNLDASSLLDEVEAAVAAGLNAKPVILGPVSYLWLGVQQDQADKLDLLENILLCYAELLAELHEAGAEWVQIDEPILALELDEEWKHALLQAYYALQRSSIKTLVASYFGKLEANINLLCELPVDGIHLDAINAEDEVLKVIDWLPNYKVVSLGVVNAQATAKTDLDDTLEWLQPVNELLGDRLWLAPSCSLTHLSDNPNNTSLIESAEQKLAEIKLLAMTLEADNESESKAAA